MNVLFLPMLAFNRIWIVRGQTVWSKGILVLMRATCGLKVEVRGTENLPKGRALLACKHQSIFETTAFHWLVEDPAVILKKELLSVPVYGWYCRKTKMIAVDRKGHASALRSMISQAEQALEDERQIIIFPEGTRTAVDDEMPYQPGIAALYTKLDTPVIPVALNTGLFWPRKKFMCRPGVIIIEFLPAIEAGLKRKDFVSKLKQSIDDNTSRLVAEGREKYIEK
ncbi:MAG: lysophospholipid acyltransferase family protein [Pseudomonas marincola]